MKARTYRAETMAEALNEVKRDLGRRAVILRTRTAKSGGFFGLGARTVVEITASQEDCLPETGRGVRMEAKPEGVGFAKGVAMAAAAPISVVQSRPIAVERELRDIRALLEGVVRRMPDRAATEIPSQLLQFYTRLIQNQVAEELATALVRRASDCCKRGQPVRLQEINRTLVQAIAGILKEGCPIDLSLQAECRRVVLVGPTGVGKTTTIAKLAALFRLKQKKKVGLITLDTYRIAAVDQLRTYAKIMDLPLEVALAPGDLAGAVERLRGYDVVLIDTAGRSPQDTDKLEELRKFLEAAQPHETHLVLSCNSSSSALEMAVERFSKLGVQRIIFTKLDEAIGLGTLLGVMQRVRARLSYVTTGQDVPDDIEVGDATRLAEMMVGGD